MKILKRKIIIFFTFLKSFCIKQAAAQGETAILDWRKNNLRVKVIIFKVEDGSYSRIYLVTCLLLFSYHFFGFQLHASFK